MWFRFFCPNHLIRDTCIISTLLIIASLRHNIVDLLQLPGYQARYKAIPIDVTHEGLVCGTRRIEFDQKVRVQFELAFRCGVCCLNPFRFIPPIPVMMKVSQQRHESIRLIFRQRIIVVVRVVAAATGFREKHHD